MRFVLQKKVIVIIISVYKHPCTLWLPDRPSERLQKDGMRLRKIGLAKSQKVLPKPAGKL